MNKKGFSLIELLAVIIILSVILMITFPVVNNIVEHTKEVSAKSSAVEYAKTIASYYSIYRYDGNATNDIPNNVDHYTSVDLEVKGDSPDYVDVSLSYGKIISGYIIFGEYKMTFIDGKITDVEKKAWSYGTIAYYNFDDFQEPTINTYPRVSTTLAFTSGFDGVNYGFNVTNNMQQIIDDAGSWDLTSSITKVSRINSGVSQRDYVSVNLPSTLNSTNVISFWYYGTYGTTITPYNNDSSASIYYLDSTGNWIGGSTSQAVPVPLNTWTKIVLKIVNRGVISGTGWSWTILHSNQNAATLNNTEYWKFTQFQYENKDYATNYVATSRTAQVKDMSLYDNHATLTNTNTPRWVSDAKFGAGAYVFDGSNDYILSDTLISLTGSQTYSAWIKPNNLTGIKGIVSVHNHVSTSNLGLNLTGNKISVSIGYTDGTREYDTKQSIASIPINTWTHVAMVYSSVDNNVKLYINGVLDSTHAIAKTIKYTNEKVLIGQWASSYLGNNVFTGNIDDVTIFDRALDSTEITSLYNEIK